MARGAAGAALLAVPVAVAAAIGFGTGLSGLAGGLSEVASGPDDAPVAGPAPAAADDLGPPLVSLADTPSGAGGGGGDQGVGDDGAPVGGGGGGGTVPGGGSGGSPQSDGGAGGGGGLPDVTLPGGGSGGGDPGSSVGQVVDGVNDTVDGVLGQAP